MIRSPIILNLSIRHLYYTNGDSRDPQQADVDGRAPILHLASVFEALVYGMEDAKRRQVDKLNNVIL